MRHALSEDSVSMPGHCLTFMMFHGQLSQETCRMLVQEDFPDHEDLIVPALNDELYLRRGLGQMQRRSILLDFAAGSETEDAGRRMRKLLFCSESFFCGNFFLSDKNG